MNNINKVDINSINLNNSYFHFVDRNDFEILDKEALKAKAEDEAKIDMSKGGKGVLGSKNSFIYEIKQLKISDIPEAYRKYFDISNFGNSEQVKPRQVYKAMEKKFKDEVCLLVEKEQIFMVVTPNGDTAIDVIEYLYEKIMQHAKTTGTEGLVRSFLGDLCEMMEYLKQKNNGTNEDKKVHEEIENDELALIIVKKEKWYEKVLTFIKKIFSYKRNNEEEIENV